MSYTPSSTSDRAAEMRNREHTYADANCYFLPNDIPEQQRLEEQALGLKELLGNRISFAPLNTSTPRVVDIGCGTGTATRHFASTHPQGTIFGVDLSSIAPRPSDPNNLTYIQGDIRRLAGHTPALAWSSADLAFSRMLVSGMTDWPSYIALLARLVKPGGYVEAQEVGYQPMWLRDSDDPSGLVTTALGRKYADAMDKAAEARGMDMACGAKLAGWMRKAGLEVVVERVYKVPLGEWAARRGGEGERARRIGRLVLGETVPVAVFGMMTEMCRGRVTEEEMEALQRELLEDCREQEGVYKPYYVVVGRKPEE